VIVATSGRFATRSSAIAPAFSQFPLQAKFRASLVVPVTSGPGRNSQYHRARLLSAFHMRADQRDAGRCIEGSGSNQTELPRTVRLTLSSCRWKDGLHHLQ
jgi:hypothetical protein